MSTHGLTKRQLDAMIFIQTYIDRHGASPSYREIMEGIGLQSISGVQRLVNGLVTRGWLGRMRYQSRSLVIRTRINVAGEHGKVRSALQNLLTEVDAKCGGRCAGNSRLVRAADAARSIISEVSA